MTARRFYNGAKIGGGYIWNLNETHHIISDKSNGYLINTLRIFKICIQNITFDRVQSYTDYISCRIVSGSTNAIEVNYSANNILLSIFKDDFKVQLDSYHYDDISIYCSFYSIGSSSSLFVDIDVYANYIPIGRNERIDSSYCSQFFAIAPIVTIAKGHVISDIGNVIVSEVEAVGD